MFIERYKNVPDQAISGMTYTLAIRFVYLGVKAKVASLPDEIIDNPI